MKRPTPWPSSLTLTVGERFELTLPGLGTAGYRWGSDVSGDVGAVSLVWRSGSGGDDGGTRRAGASRPERLEITASSPGRVTVHLTQRRPWEAGPPRREHDIVIEVSAARPN